MRKLRYLPLFFVFIVLFSLFVPLIHVNAQSGVQTAVFRPIALGSAEGTLLINPLGATTYPIDREVNLVGWNVSKFSLSVRFAMPIVYFLANPVVLYSPELTLMVSVDRGVTYSYNRTLPAGILVNPVSWAGGFYVFTNRYEVSPSDYGLFTPETRVKLVYPAGFPSLYFPLYYWSSGQLPVPPYDFIDAQGGYVQYAVSFVAEYVSQEIPYVGSYGNFAAFPDTLSKLTSAGEMILDTMMLSGVGNEVVVNATNKLDFGTSTWIIVYSSQLAMMQLLKLQSVVNDTRYNVAAKRFISWMWSKQNLTDGSFPFILTDGDQHPWYNTTLNLYYGADKIDSFSACAISLMKAYYDATGDIAFVNAWWSRIEKAKDFVVSLMNTTVWLPVDGWHFDGSVYTKSEMNWLHDSCEAYQGFKDYAFLEGVRGNSGEEAYWDGYGDNVAGGIRMCFWNETLGRYAGMYYVNTGVQEPVLVYNAITPLVYGIDTNLTRAVMTMSRYVNWGILTGRYLDLLWASDYSIFNEYSTMSGMIYSGFDNLYETFGYNETWVKLKIIEISKFLFVNPIYPERNLQSENGFLDFVNLVEYNWAAEYARLVEGSAWFIDGFIDLPSMLPLFNFTASEMVELNSYLGEQDVYWQAKYAEFFTATGFQYNTVKGYPEWEQWTKDAQLFVKWYDYRFLKELVDKGYIGDSPWWEEWVPDDDWLTGDNFYTDENWYSPSIFNVNVALLINAFVVCFVIFAPAVGLFLLKLGKWGFISGLFIGAILGFVGLPLVGLAFPVWVLFGVILVVVGAVVAALKGGS